MSTPIQAAACKGLWQLFDSIKPTDHLAAKAICANCPALIACQRHTLAVRETSRLTGTWAGQLYGVRGSLKPTTRTWTRTQLLAAHAAWTRGARNDEIAEGERVYQRIRGRARYARAKAAK